MHLPARQPFKLGMSRLRSQAFHWMEDNGWYYGVVSGHAIKIRQSGYGVEFFGDVSEEALTQLVQRYFDPDLN